MELLGQGYTKHVDGLETSCAGTPVGTVLIFFLKKISYNRHRVTDYGSGKAMFLRTFSSVERKSFYTKKLVSD